MTLHQGYDRAVSLDRQLAPLDLQARLALIGEIARDAVFTTSLGIEDQVIIDAIGRGEHVIHVITLQTGRLFPETLALIEETSERYGIAIEEFHPEGGDVESYTATYGLNGFYDSIEARHACCAMRKLKPLARALEGHDVWVTGLRRDQSGARSATPFAEWDPTRGLVKINPLADWTVEDVNAYVAAHDVPVNPLHARGYPSIGCEPCTRAVKPGEDERAGRWWWENDDKRECGLHVPEASAIPAAS